MALAIHLCAYNNININIKTTYTSQYKSISSTSKTYCFLQQKYTTQPVIRFRISAPHNLSCHLLHLTIYVHNAEPMHGRSTVFEKHKIVLLLVWHYMVNFTTSLETVRMRHSERSLSIPEWENIGELVFNEMPTHI